MSEYEKNRIVRKDNVEKMDFGLDTMREDLLIKNRVINHLSCGHSISFLDIDGEFERLFESLGGSDKSIQSKEVK